MPIRRTIPVANPPSGGVTGTSNDLPSTDGQRGKGRKKWAASERPDLDFQPVADEPPARAILSVLGKQRTGKNHFAFTAPGDVCVHSLDPNLDAVASKFKREARERRIVACRYNLPAISSRETALIESVAGPEWARFRANYERSLQEYRNVIVDTGTLFWELLRCASFGWLSQVRQAYTPVNAEMVEVIKEGYAHNANVFWIHHMVEEYKDTVDATGKTSSIPTGKWRLDGFKKVGNNVQAEVECMHEPGLPHQVRIINSTYNPDCEGMVLDEPGCTFADVMAMVAPEIAAERWEG